MSHPNPDIRLKREFGGVKAALSYCVEMNMNKTQAAEFLGISERTVRREWSYIRARLHKQVSDSDGAELKGDGDG